MMKDIFARIRTILLENLGCDEEDIKLDTSLIDDLGADSLDIVELAMAIEEEFGINIADEDFEKLQTIKAIVNYIKSGQDG